MCQTAIRTATRCTFISMTTAALAVMGILLGVIDPSFFLITPVYTDILSELLKNIPVFGSLANMLIDGIAVPISGTQTALLEKATYTLLLFVCCQGTKYCDTLVCAWMPVPAADGLFLAVEKILTALTFCIISVLNTVLISRAITALLQGLPVIWFLVLIGITFLIGILYVSDAGGALLDAVGKLLIGILDAAVLYLSVLCLYNLNDSNVSIRISCAVCLTVCILYISIISAQIVAGIRK